MKPEQVVDYIEGEPYVSKISIEPGLTNSGRISGLNTEDSEPYEGMIRYDIIFYVRMRNEINQIIVNIEIQKDKPYDYFLLNRAIFYSCRMISSQRDRDFFNNSYDDIKNVYTIWICLNQKSNSINYIHLAQEHIWGDAICDGNMNMINIIMLGIADEIQENTGEIGPNRMLSVLLSSKLVAEEKISILQDEYNIVLDDNSREEVSLMCNLSEAIEQEALKRGIEQGIEQGTENAHRCIITKMYNNGFSFEQIEIATGKNKDEVLAIVQ